MNIQNDLNPHVGELTNRLLMSFVGKNGRFKDDEWAVITQVLNYAAEAEQRLISQQRRISQLEMLSMTDDLTGLGNRRSLEDFMKRALSAARRYRELGAMVYIDLDNFKTINDTMGHDAGDAVLCEVAKLLLENTRSSDLVIRQGGDEFVVVLTRCQPELGRKRAVILEEMLNSLVVTYGATDIPVRASVGAEPFGPRSCLIEVLRRADQRMLDKKRARDLNDHETNLRALGR
ncbi:MAG: GGDEF domain-containing protein [Sphingomonadales bacterium]